MGRMKVWTVLPDGRELPASQEEVIDGRASFDYKSAWFTPTEPCTHIVSSPRDAVLGRAG